MNFLINREDDLAVRICAFLAAYYGEEPIPLSVIAKELYISRAFTSKIVHQLVKNEILGSVQGRYGGVFLKKDPRKTSVYAILEALNFRMAINECLIRPAVCPFNEDCKIHNFFAEQQKILIENFQNTMIIDLAFNKRSLKKSNKRKEVV
jgi:Rrf2 family nitric oxide-sensitive transcriptional repressor